MKDNMKNYLAWLSFLFCFAIMPGLLSIYGYNYLATQKETTEKAYYRQEFIRFFDSLSFYKTPELFWCYFLSDNIRKDRFTPGKTKEELLVKLKKLNKELDFEYMVFQIKSSKPVGTIKIASKRDWALALKILSRHFSGDFSYPEKETQAICRLFGPQFTFKHITNAYTSEKTLVWPDSSRKKPVLFIRQIRNCIVIITIKTENLENNLGIWALLKRFQKETNNKYLFAGVEDGSVSYSEELPIDVTQEINEGIKKATQLKKTLFRTKNFLLFQKFVRPGFTVFGTVNLKHLERLNFNYYLVFFLGYLILLLLTSLRKNCPSFRRNSPLVASSFLLKLFGLRPFFSSQIPLSVPTTWESLAIQ